MRKIFIILTLCFYVGQLYAALIDCASIMCGSNPFHINNCASRNCMGLATDFDSDHTTCVECLPGYTLTAPSPSNTHNCQYQFRGCVSNCTCNCASNPNLCRRNGTCNCSGGSPNYGSCTATCNETTHCCVSSTGACVQLLAVGLNDDSGTFESRCTCH